MSNALKLPAARMGNWKSYSYKMVNFLNYSPFITPFISLSLKTPTELPSVSSVFLNTCHYFFSAAWQSLREDFA